MVNCQVLEELMKGENTCNADKDDALESNTSSNDLQVDFMHMPFYL